VSVLETIKELGTATAPLGLVSLVAYAVRAVFIGTWVPRPQHEREIQLLTNERDIWRSNSEKWEAIAEGRLKVVQQKQEAVVAVTTQVVEGIRKVGTADVSVEKEI
jgi:hypothetical protein